MRYVLTNVKRKLSVRHLKSRETIYKYGCTWRGNVVMRSKIRNYKYFRFS